MLPLEIELNDKKVTTTYGVKWHKTRLDMGYYIELGKIVGFKVVVKEEIDQIYCIRFKKKVSI